VRGQSAHWGEIAPGVSPNGAKCQNVFCFLSVTNATWPFGHLSCADFDHLLKKQMQITVHMCTLVKNFLISAWDFPGPPKNS